MRVIFWGTRGSLSASYTGEVFRKKLSRSLDALAGLDLHNDDEVKRRLSGGSGNKDLRFSILGAYGSNTSCVEIQAGEEYLICDAGTGIRDLGNHIAHVRKGQHRAGVFNIFISHPHWDHIQGFPFFTPAFIPGNRVNIYGFHRELEQAFITQQSPAFFPIPLGAMGADIRFFTLEEGKGYEIAGFQVRGIKQNHPGDSYGYRFEKDGRTMVYSTDSEHMEDAYYNEGYPFIDFIKGADLLVFDAQYPLLDAISVKESWGHSNNVIAVELGVKAGVKHLCIYHNEPTFEDERLDEYLEETRRYLRLFSKTSTLKIDIAYDGMQVEI
jgi:phosphoribosyl 1,2-cyclic phosphodiesterase